MQGDVSSDAIFICSNVCPEQYIVFAEETAGQFLRASEFSELFPCYLGEPFSFANSGADMFYFPIYHAGDIICLLRVYSDMEGNIAGVLSKCFAEELNAIAGVTSQNDPLKILFDGAKITFEVEDNEFTVFSYSDDMGQELIDSSEDDFSNCVIVECAEKYGKEIAAKYVATMSTESSTYLDLFMGDVPEETQPQGYEWCAAYSSTAIMRYKGLNVYAIDLMTYAIGDDPQPTDSIYREDICLFANARGFSATLTYSTLSYARLCNEIDNDRPVYLSMKESGTDKDSYHAIVLCGYDNNNAMMRIWNPWYTCYETIYSLNNYVPYLSQHRTYAYYATIYNWKRG